MPSYIVKPDRVRDFYVLWSTIVDAPTAFGTRAELTAEADLGPQAAERFARADEFGSSCRVGETAPWYGWDYKAIIYNQQGILRRHRLRAVCELLRVGDAAGVKLLLDQFKEE